MPYRLDFPNSREAEPYDDLVDYGDVFEAVLDEAEKVVGDNPTEYFDAPPSQDEITMTAHKVAELALSALWTPEMLAGQRSSSYRLRDDEPLMRLTYQNEKT